VCRSKHVEPLKNFEIVNSITKLHIVGISTEWITLRVLGDSQFFISHSNLLREICLFYR